VRGGAAWPFARDRRLAVEAFLAASAGLALLAQVHGLEVLTLAGLALLVAATLLLSVQAPVGPVPVGYAVVIALAGLLRAGEFFPVAALGVLLTVLPLLARYDHVEAGRLVVRWGAASFVAGGAAALSAYLVPGPSPMRTLLHVGVAGVSFLAADLASRNWRPMANGARTRLHQAAPVYVSLLCGAGLIAVAYNEDGVWMAIVAGLPLVLTRFAFDRYAAAEEAYRQTIKALSIVPEVAGVTPLGHGERSAVYAVAMARELGLPDDATERVATAARLHHIGYVTLDDPQDAHNANRLLLARLGGDILRETEFLADVGDLIESVHDDTRLVTREAAVVRVATTFDDMILENPERAPGALELLAFNQSGPYGAAAVLALRRILEVDPAVLDRAVASGAPMTEAAAASKALHG